MDIEEVLRLALQELVRVHAFRLPVTFASVGQNGAVLFSRFEMPGLGPAGAVSMEHIVGKVGGEGFLAPIHLMATDATGRVKLVVQRGAGSPTVLDASQ